MDDTSSQPILLIGAGQGAMETLAELPRLARNLLVRVPGPFGLIVGPGSDGNLRTSTYFWLSDISVPNAAPKAASAEQPATDLDMAWFSDVCSLVRGLRARGEVFEQGNGSHVRIHAYVVIDLTVPGVVSFATSLIGLVRQVDPSIEMTGLALTGRTAETGTARSFDWFKPFEELLTRLQQPDMLQRLYVLDGEDTNKAWLRNLSQMHRIGAQFLLHHSLSPYRHHLRRREKTRSNLSESFINFCGSIGCKRFNWDPSAVAREIAVSLAGDPAFQELRQGTLSKERGDVLDALAQRLVEDVSDAYQDNGPAPGASTGVSPAAAGTPKPEEKALAAVKQILTEVCAEKPMLSLHWFLSRLSPRLNGLTTFSRLRGRWDARYRVAQALRKQVEGMHAVAHPPLPQPKRGPGPARVESPSAVLSQPVPIGHYVLAMVVATAGLGLIAAGGLTQHLWPIVLGGITALWASLVVLFSTGWVRCPRVEVRAGLESSEPVPETSYRARTPMVRLMPSLALVLAGVGCIAWLLHTELNGAIYTRAGLLSGGAILCGLIGVFLLWLIPFRASLPAGVPDEEEAPELSMPPNRLYSVAGLVFLTGAWVLLCLANHSLDALRNTGALLAGLLFVWGGLALGLLPRHKRVALTCGAPPFRALAAPPRVVRISTVECPSTDGSRLTAFAERLRSWVDRLLGAGVPSGSGACGAQDGDLEEPLPRVFTSQWQSQLAAAIKGELQSQWKKPLEEIARDRVRWVDCLVAELSNPGTRPIDPLHLFCLSYVTRWLQEKPLEHLISGLRVGRQTLASAITDSVPVRWPQTRDDPEMDTSVVAVGQGLRSLVEPDTERQDSHRFIAADWQDPYSIYVVRLVQGLSSGWRGYSELPGQSKPAGES